MTTMPSSHSVIKYRLCSCRAAAGSEWHVERAGVWRLGQGAGGGLAECLFVVVFLGRRPDGLPIPRQGAKLQRRPGSGAADRNGTGPAGCRQGNPAACRADWPLAQSTSSPHLLGPVRIDRRGCLRGSGRLQGDGQVGREKLAAQRAEQLAVEAARLLKSDFELRGMHVDVDLSAGMSMRNMAIGYRPVSSSRGRPRSRRVAARLRIARPLRNKYCSRGFDRLWSGLATYPSSRTPSSKLATGIRSEANSAPKKAAIRCRQSAAAGKSWTTRSVVP